MKRMSVVLMLTALVLAPYLRGARADTLIVSSNTFDFKQPLGVLSSAATTIQLDYNVNVYKDWLCAAFRGRTAQQSAGMSMPVDTGSSVATAKLTVLPSVDAGLMVKLMNATQINPYVFSLLNYTMLNSTISYADHQSSSDISAFGMRTGLGTNILLSTELPTWLFNVDMGYQYLPVTVSDVGNVDINGLFVNLGFGLSF